MPKVIVTALVEDAAKWVEGFRTHGELFRRQTINRPIHFATNEQNEVTICFEPDDLATYFEILDSPDTAEAMQFDGVRRETVKVVVLDGSFDPGG